MMERNIRTSGTVSVVVLLLAGVCAFATAHYAGILSGRVSALFLAVGFLAAVVSRFQMRLEESERVEKLELEELARKPKDAALFKDTEAELLPARKAREQFEKYFVPGFSIVLLIIQALGAWWLWNGLNNAIEMDWQSPARRAALTVGAALFGGEFLMLFLFGKYAANKARIENQRLVRPAAGYLLLGAYLCLTMAIATGLAVAGYPKIDLYLARVVVLLLGLVAIENAATLVFEVYRPRLKGQEPRLLYESRLVGLISQPEGIFTTAAQVLDYQFGFKVSETWFYQFLKKYLGFFVAAQLAVLLLSSCFVFIEAGEQAILERFGRPVAGRAVLSAGGHLKWPWPIDKVYRYRTDQIQTFTIGYTAEAEEAEAEGHEEHSEEVELWTVAHYKEEFNMLVASRETTNASPAVTAQGDQAVPVNLLAVNVPVHYQITNVLAWGTRYEDPGAILEQTAMREATRYMVNVDINEIMTTGREPAGGELSRRIQQRANELILGVHIVYVGLANIHPPVRIAPAYQEVVAALQEKEAKIHEAEGYAARAVPMARAEAIKRQREAEAYAARTAAGAEAKAMRFTNQVVAYQASPPVFAMRGYLKALVRGGAEARKYIIATTNTEDVIIMNLEDKLRLGIEDVPLAPAQNK